MRSLFKRKRTFLILFIIGFCLLFGNSKAWVIDYTEHWISLDDHDRPLPENGWHDHHMGGDRCELNLDTGEVKYEWDGDSVYKATVINCPGQWTWGGMQYSLIRADWDDISLDFNAILGPYVKEEYQEKIIKVEILVSDVYSPSNNEDLELRLELKDVNGTVVWSKTWTNITPGICDADLDPIQIGKVEQFVWVMDRAKLGDSVSIDWIRFKAEVTDLPTKEQAFLWAYSWLMANYDPNTGMVQDRGYYHSGDYENVTATAKAAKIVYYAYKKGYTTYEDAKEIITKIANTLIYLPQGPPGKNTLWPHFTKNGGTEIDLCSEWSSGDTAFAALDIIAALQMLGDPWGQIKALENFLKAINWEDLLSEDGSISHGYCCDGTLISDGWKGFGMETIGVNWAYASATGCVALMEPPPSDNGSGFIDNANYPIVLSGKDRWGNDWDEYRNIMADKQIGWYCTAEHYNKYLCEAGLFGLSAAESPECSYFAYGVGGKYTSPNDGNGEVIVLHYSGMIADIKPNDAKHVWEVLRDRDADFLQDIIVISPLNYMESIKVNKDTGKCKIKYRKISWNIALQAEGWALADLEIRTELITAIKNNSFLCKGYKIIKCAGDFNNDGDVDGSDLAGLAANPSLLDVFSFAAHFGRTDCPLWEGGTNVQN